MTTRYFKATDGQFTVFRATTTRAYLSAYIRPSGGALHYGGPEGGR